MRKWLKVILVIVGLIILINGTKFIILCIELYDWEKEIQMYGDDLEYYEKIKKTENHELNLHDIFDFEWEKAYLVPNRQLSHEVLDKMLGANCNFYPIVEESPRLRVVFIKERNCVYQFLYDTRYIQFGPLGEFIYNDNAVFKISNENNLIELRQKN